jgi:hypothetical protein
VQRCVCPLPLPLHFSLSRQELDWFKQSSFDEAFVGGVIALICGRQYPIKTVHGSDTYSSPSRVPAAGARFLLNAFAPDR